MYLINHGWTQMKRIGVRLRPSVVNPLSRVAVNPTIGGDV